MMPVYAHAPELPPIVATKLRRVALHPYTGMGVVAAVPVFIAVLAVEAS